MAMRSGFFDSTEVVETVGGFPRGNKAETADFFAAYFSSFVGNGIYLDPPSAFQVLPESGLTVRIRPGKCFINGYFAFDDEPEDKTFPFDTQPHEYWLVLRLDLADGSIKKVWVSDPAPGELPVRGTVLYDLVVARVSVGAGVTTITDSMISDLRADPFYCGRVKSLVDGIGQTVEYADVAGTLVEETMAQLVQRTGSIMTGPLTLHGDPASPLHAATKQYVDSRAPRLVELCRYTSSGTFRPSEYPSVGNRYLIMLLGAGGGGYQDSNGKWWSPGGSAGGLLFVDFYYPPNSPITSFPVIVGAGASGSDGGSTSFWGFSVPGGNKAWGTNKPGAGVSVAGFTSESGQLNSGGNSLYGAGATNTTSAGYGGGGNYDKPGGNGLCIIYGYVA